MCGIETNLVKVKTILDMGPPNELKHMQKLMGCLASLRRFISQLGEKGFPLYKLLWKTPNQRWTPRAHKAFDDLKDFLTKPLVLVAPNNEEPLLLYVVTTT